MRLRAEQLNRKQWSSEALHTCRREIRQVLVQRDETSVQQRQHGAYWQRLHAEEGHRPRIVLRLRPATQHGAPSTPQTASDTPVTVMML